MQDYYSTLGVLPSAELAVIKGAYKAMMNIYHPDKYKGDKYYAIEKSQIITTAYEVLKDPVKRAAYDLTLGSKHDYTEEVQESQASCDEERKINAEQWQYALKYYPELNDYENELAQLSPSLVMQFRLALIENKKFGKAYVLCGELKREFLKRFFGSNFEIQQFASELLKYGHRDAARELNKTINFIGDDIDVENLKASITREFCIHIKSENKYDESIWKKSNVKNELYKSSNGIDFNWSDKYTIILVCVLAFFIVLILL